MAYRAEYIWIDGTEPVPMMRSKTKVIEDGKEPGIWGFDGSSTNQAPGSNSDCVLQPVYAVPDTLRNPDGSGDDVLVLCEVLLPESFAPHPTNTRAACVEVAVLALDQRSLIGLGVSAKESHIGQQVDGRAVAIIGLGVRICRRAGRIIHLVVKIQVLSGGKYVCDAGNDF